MYNNNQRYHSNDPNQQVGYNPNQQQPNPFPQYEDEADYDKPTKAAGRQINNLQNAQLMARNFAQTDNEYSDEYSGLVVNGRLEIRAKFIAKVYSIMSFQLGITFLMILGCYYSSRLSAMIVAEDSMSLTALTWICFVVAFIIEIAIFCCRKVARRVPINYILLIIFTLCFSTIVVAPCIICFRYLENGVQLVILAGAITLGITILLTVYAWFTTSDYSGLGQFCFVISLTLLLVCIVGIFVKNSWFQLIICGLSVIVYSGYVIMDTQLIVGNQSFAFSIDDYIVAALMLYIDLVVLFLRILEILMILFGKN